MEKILLRQKITLIICGLLLGLVLLETGLRLGGFVYLSWQEHNNRLSLKQKGAYRILCLGESTTALWGEDSYPNQLEEILNQRNTKIRFSVINKGMPGINTEGIVLLLKDNLDEYAPDIVITMMGINDDWSTTAPFDYTPTKNIALFKSFRIYKLARMLALNILNKAKKMGIWGAGGKEATLKEYWTNAQLGYSYNNHGEPDKAKEVLKRCVQLNPKNVCAYIELGWSYWSEAKYDKAEEILKEAAEVNPENVRVYINFGLIYKEQGKFDKAEEMFKKSLKIDPKSEWACASLMRLYREQGKQDELRKMLRENIQLNSQGNGAPTMLACYYNELGDSQLAERYFRETDRPDFYNPVTCHNYEKLKEIVTERGIKLVCVQYPVCSVEPLKRVFRDQRGIIFIDNEKVFKEALKKSSYSEYFTDMFGGEFGHCTRKGNRLLAENIADAILREGVNK